MLGQLLSTLHCLIQDTVRLLILDFFPIGTALFGSVRLLISDSFAVGTINGISSSVVPIESLNWSGMSHLHLVFKNRNYSCIKGCIHDFWFRAVAHAALWGFSSQIGGKKRQGRH